MKILFTAYCFIVVCICAAQDDPCLEKILAYKGTTIQGSISRNGTPDYEMQKKFIDAAHAMMKSYEPQGIQAKWSSIHSPAAYGKPLHEYTYRLGGFPYYCSGDKLALNHETSNWFQVRINGDFSRLLYDTVKSYEGTGFNVLREGIPEEIQPGVWKFKNVLTPLGFQREGLTKLWLFTYAGQLPWKYVTRREFLQNRRRMLLALLKNESEYLQTNLADLERAKKDIEKVTKNNPEQYAAWIKSDYEPAPRRYQEQHDKTTSALKLAIDRVNDQLDAPATELDKQAIVIRSEQNHLDYNFTDNWQERFAQVLVKPNPAYFKKGISASTPQLIEASIQYYPLDTVSVLFSEAMEKMVKVDYLNSWIAKTTPPPIKF